MLDFFKKIEFKLILFFFLHWHRIIPKNINYCENTGYFYKLQSIVLFLMQRSQYWSSDQWKIYTGKRLRTLYRNAILQDISYQGRIDLNTNDYLAALHAMPVLSREELRIKFSSAIEVHEKRGGDYLLGRTSGTSGIPMQVGKTKFGETQCQIARRRLFQFIGLKPHEEYLYPLTSPNPNYCPKNVFKRKDFETLINSSEDFFKEIEEKNIKAIFAFPSVLLFIKEKANQIGLKAPSIKAIVTTGENLTPATRHSIQSYFGVKVYNYFGSVEISAVAQECQFQDGLHINQEFYLVEILSTEGRVVESGGLGSVVITSFDINLLPIFRYDTGNEGRIMTENCPCGRTLPRLQIKGRSSEPIKTTDGFITEHAFKEILDSYDPKLEKIKQFQLVLDADYLELVIVPAEKFLENDLGAIENICKKFLRDKIKFSVRTAQSVQMIGMKAPSLLTKKR